MMYVLSDDDIERVLKWIPSKEKLQLVSGDTGECLTRTILERWMTNAVETLVLRDEKPTALCMLSTQETPWLPSSHVEVCHLLVDPDGAYYRNGSALVLSACAEAKRLGFERACGRVRPHNGFGLRLMRLNNFEEFTGRDSWQVPGYRWFSKELGCQEVSPDGR